LNLEEVVTFEEIEDRYPNNRHNNNNGVDLLKLREPQPTEAPGGITFIIDLPPLNGPPFKLVSPA